MLIEVDPSVANVLSNTQNFFAMQNLALAHSEGKHVLLLQPATFRAIVHNRNFGERESWLR